MSEQQKEAFRFSSHIREEEQRMQSSAVQTELRLERKLCDVVIRVGEVEFDAHKIILCSCSSYFRALFTGAWATTKKQYTIPGVSPEMMNLIINYAYTHSVPVTKDNVLEVLAAADQFLVSGMVQTCTFFLQDQLCLGNCINMWKLMDYYHLPDFRHKFFRYILHHFEEILCVSQEFLQLSAPQLAAIIESDCLHVKHEEAVFEAVLRWINHMPAQRHGHIAKLLSKVRLGLMNIHYLHNVVMENALIKDSHECIPIISNTLAEILTIRTQPYISVLSRPRLPPAIMLVIGGKHEHMPMTSLAAYDSRADHWVTVSSGSIYRVHHGTVVVDSSMYLIGGRCRGVHLNTMQKFDFVTCSWQQVAPMHSRRCFVSVAVHNGCIYAIGGCSGHCHLNSVERYHPKTDQWTTVASMRSRRSGAGAATLNDEVYICGGFNGRYILFTAECYNPNTDQWTMITSMRHFRSGLGVAAYNGLIYAVGGSSVEGSPMCTVETYNPRTNRWSQAPAMSDHRSNFGIGVMDDQLFVVGGTEGSTAMSVERYDDEVGLWYKASGMERPRSGLSCCVLYGLDDVAENLFSRGPLMLNQ